MKKLKWLAASLIIAGSMMVPATVFAQARGQLTGDHVRVRETPTLETDYNILFQVSRGQAVEILDISGDFYRVNVRDSQDVYIFREFIGVTETTGVLQNSTAPIVAAPDLDDILGISEDNLPVTGRYGNWYEVYFNGERGFVEGHYLNVSFGESLQTVRPPRIRHIAGSSGILADDLIAYAKGYIGVPYRFGSTNPSRGFDCSGFVTVVMRKFDIYLQRSSASMASANGLQVDRNALEAGDLVFFATGGGSRVSHVGIYIGGGQFIHSASDRGVTVTAMSENYWRTRFVRANRVL